MESWELRVDLIVLLYALSHVGQPTHDGIYVKMYASNSMIAEEFKNMTSVLVCEYLLDKKNKIPHSVACLA